MANVMLDIWDGFPGLRPDVPAYKVCVFTVDFEFRIRVNESSSRHSY